MPDRKLPTIDFSKPSNRDILVLQRKLSVIIAEDAEFQEYVKNRGLYFDRCAVPDDQGIAETIFSDTIKAEHEKGAGMTLNLVNKLGPAALTGALTMFQWLATNNGRAVLDVALRQIGYMIVQRPNKD